MADVGTEFTDFLKAYCLEDYNKLSSESVTDAEINAIFSKHKSKFDAWRKIPQWQRDKYFNKVPEPLLDKAARDPNFTETDAIENEQRYLEKKNPYSPIPEALENHPCYPQLLEQGIKITPAHIAVMKLAADEICRRGYSAQAAEELSVEKVFRKALFEQREQILGDSTLSAQEKEQKLQENGKQLDGTLLRTLDVAKEDLKVNQPERMLLRTLRDMQMGKIDQEQALPEIDMYVKRIILMDRMDVLAMKMNESLYQKVLKPETKEILDYVLKENQADFNHLEAMKQKVVDAKQKDQKRIQRPAGSAYAYTQSKSRDRD